MTDPMPLESGEHPHPEADEPSPEYLNLPQEANLLFIFRSARLRALGALAERCLQPLPVFKDFFLIIRPVSTWNRIVTGQHGAGFIFFFYLLPLLLLETVIEGHGLVLLGRQQVAEGMNNRFTADRVLVYEAASGLLFLLFVYFTALMIKSFANACHKRSRLSQSLVVMLHAIGPVFFIQLFNGFPEMYLWLTWFFGVLLAISALYQGLPRIMQPDPPAAMGLFCGSAVVLLLMLFGWRFLTYWYLIGELKSVEDFLAGIAGKLPF